MLVYLWRIEMLGGLRVSNNNQEVCRFRTTKAGFLLSYLALSGKRVHPREELIDLLWPEETSTQRSRQSLRQELFTLRRQLSTSQNSAKSLIAGDHAQVLLVSRAYTTDVAEMENLIQEAGRMPDSEGRRRLLEQAVSLYRGELLPGYYDEWVLEKRRYLAALYLESLAVLANDAARHSNFEQAIWYMLQSFVTDPRDDFVRENLTRLLRCSLKHSDTGATDNASLSRFLKRLENRTLENKSLENKNIISLERQARKILRGRTQPHLAQSRHSNTINVNGSVNSNDSTKLNDSAKSNGVGTCHFLPIPLTRLIGRTDALAEIVSCLSAVTELGFVRSGGKATSPIRCLTLIGPGGIGKTRLAIEAAQCLTSDYETVAFVPLAGMSTAQLLPQAIAGALRLSPSGIPLLEAVTGYLRQRPTLLVLDNLEHLASDAPPMIELLLQRIPTLRCLMTSRQLVCVAGEHLYPVAPLSLPASIPASIPVSLPVDPQDRLAYNRVRKVVSEGRPAGDILTEDILTESVELSESVELFLDRARNVRWDFAVTPRNVALVNTLCAALEGIPLAIELAAARLGMLSLAEMVDGLSDRFALLKSEGQGDEGQGDEVRHRSLEAVLEWSLSLLPPDICRFLLRLSVFSGGWTAEAAKAVCREPQARDYLERLRLCSLVSSTVVAIDRDMDTNAPLTLRFSLLETVRAYGQAQLSPQESQDCALAHADFYSDFVRDAPHYHGGRERIRKIEQFDVEYGNIRAALTWYAAPEKSLSEGGLHMAVCLAPGYWFVRGYYQEQRDWLEQFLRQTQGAGEVSDQAWGSYCLGQAAIMQADWNAAAPPLHTALALFQAMGYADGVGLALNKLGVVAQARGDFAEAQRLFEEGRLLSEGTGTRHSVAHALKCLGCLQIIQEEYAGVREQFEAALTIYREINDLVAVCMMLNELANLAIHDGCLTEADSLLAEALPLSRSCHTPLHITQALKLLGRLAQLRGDDAQAARFFEEAREARRHLNL